MNIKSPSFHLLLFTIVTLVACQITTNHTASQPSSQTANHAVKKTDNDKHNESVTTPQSENSTVVRASNEQQELALPKFNSNEFKTVSKIQTQRIIALYSRAHFVDIDSIQDVEQRVIQNLLTAMDPQKNLLTAKNIASLKPLEFSLEDVRYSGDLSNLYLTLEHIRRLIEANITKIASKAEFITNYSSKDKSLFNLQEYVDSEKELSELWTALKSEEVRQLELHGVASSSAMLAINKSLVKKAEHLQNLSDIDRYDIVINAITKAFDPHSSYLTPRDLLRYSELTSGVHSRDENSLTSSVGISPRALAGRIKILFIYPNSPAASAGLRVGQEIFAIEKDNELLSMFGMDDDEVKQFLKGESGTEVTVYVRQLDDQGYQSEKVNLVNSEFSTASARVSSKVVKTDSTDIGIVNIDSFYSAVSKDIKTELMSLASKNVKTIIVDLRDNGGGSLLESTLSAGLFIEQGPVLQVKYSNGKINVNRDVDPKRYFNGNLIVLVNQKTAGSCEIFAAAMQDYGRGIVIGENTYGYGTVQQFRQLARIYDNYQIPFGSTQFTIAQFYRINGQSTQNRGVIPDIRIPMLDSLSTDNEMSTPYAIASDTISPAEHMISGYQGLKITKLAKKFRLDESPLSKTDALKRALSIAEEYERLQVE